MSFPILSTVLWLPALGALLLLLLPRGADELARRVSLGVAVATFLISLGLLAGYMPAITSGTPLAPELQFVEQIPWLPSWGVSYSIALDGISLWLVLLTTFLHPVVVLSTWDSVHKEVRNFQILLQLLTTAMIGVFVAQDLLLFYIFWEFTLIPMTFLIGIWGGGNRIYAARKFFLYTFAGSVLMLLAIIALYVLHRNALVASDPGFVGSAEISRIVSDLRAGSFTLDTTTERLLFGAFFLAFAIKVPLWPFHTWLPDAHVEAPTAGSVVLAGVLLGQWQPELARICSRALGGLATVLLILMMLALLLLSGRQLLPYLQQNLVGLAGMALLSVLSLAIGYGIAGSDPLERRTVALVTGMRNTGLAAQLALTYGKGLPGLVPGLLAYVLITVIVTTLFLQWQQRELVPTG